MLPKERITGEGNSRAMNIAMRSSSTQIGSRPNLPSSPISNISETKASAEISNVAIDKHRRHSSGTTIEIHHMRRVSPMSLKHHRVPDSSCHRNQSDLHSSQYSNIFQSFIRGSLNHKSPIENSDVTQMDESISNHDGGRDAESRRSSDPYDLSRRIPRAMQFRKVRRSHSVSFINDANSITSRSGSQSSFISIDPTRSSSFASSFYYRNQKEVKTGVYSSKGKRIYMEDEYRIIMQLQNTSEKSTRNPEKTSFFGVFDGHAGGKCSKFLSQSLAQYISRQPDFTTNLSAATYRGFLQANTFFLKKSQVQLISDGSTAICAILRGKQLLVANVGDSRGVLSNEGNAVPLSTDHKPNCPEESRRIQARGGRITFNFGVHRVNGALAVSRAFGDRNLQEVINAEPEIHTQNLNEKDEFIILATDGLWDVIHSQEAIDIVRRCLISQNLSCRKSAMILVETALHRGSVDNITAVIIDLRGLFSDSPRILKSCSGEQRVELIQCKRRSSIF